jgi:ribosomal protein L18
MAAGYYDIVIEQGATWRLVVQVTGLDLTGATARMQARLVVTSVTPVVELSTANGRIVIAVSDTQHATLTLTLTAETTTGLSFTRAVYDLEVVLADGTVYRLLQGAVTLALEITR